MDEFGQDHSFYIWPEGHEPGEPYPEDFRERIERGLASVGLTFERV